MTTPLVVKSRFPATIDGVTEAAQWLRETAATQALSDKLAFAMEVCLEELGLNVARHGKTGGQGGPVADAIDPLDLWLSIAIDDRAVELVIEDNGVPFNVSLAPGRPIRRPLVEVIPGGLGIQLVRSFSDELLYEPIATGNRVIVRFLRQHDAETRADA